MWWWAVLKRLCIVSHRRSHYLTLTTNAGHVNIVTVKVWSNYKFFFLKGKKLWTTYLPAPVTTMALLDLPTRGFQAILVALANCEVHVYRDKNVVSTIKTPVKHIRS